MCKSCYHRFQRYGDPTWRAPDKRTWCTYCDRRAHTGGLCSAHAKKLARHGDPLGGSFVADRSRANHRLLVMLRFVDTDKCVEWPFARHERGYGQIEFDGRQHRVARLVCEFTYGPPPAGFHALHSCDNPPCCNWRHLRWGTPVENMQDAAERGRLVLPPPRSRKAVV